MLERVDVRGIHDRQAALQRAVLDEPQLVRRDPGERAGDERLAIVRMAEAHGYAGRRSEHPRRAGGTARDRVEDRALAGAGRADQEDDERRIERRGPDPDVAAQEVGESPTALECLVGPGSGCLTTRGELVESLDERTKVAR